MLTLNICLARNAATTWNSQIVWASCLSFPAASKNVSWWPCSRPRISIEFRYRDNLFRVIQHFWHVEILIKRRRKNSVSLVLFFLSLLLSTTVRTAPPGKKSRHPFYLLCSIVWSWFRSKVKDNMTISVEETNNLRINQTMILSSRLSQPVFRVVDQIGPAASWEHVIILSKHRRAEYWHKEKMDGKQENHFHFRDRTCCSSFFLDQ